MFTQFFGNYLLNKGLVDTQQLADALAIQKETRPRLGVLAINAGYMTAEQVDKVHAEQQRVDKRIGDIACDMGFLTREQVEELLSTQGAAHLQLGQALVNSGAMTNAAFADALNSYKKENSLNDVDFGGDSTGKIDDIIRKFYNFSEDDREAYLTEYVALLFKNIIRFIGDDFTPLASEHLNKADAVLAAAQKINGDFACTTIIEALSNSYLGFASRYAGEELTELDEMAHASTGEFLNLHNGLFTVNVSNEMNTELKLEPQEIMETGCSMQGEVYGIPLVFPFGLVRFLLVL
ncbi:MAG: chemotaxis protein CheX [Oscillospiraceae bacterium]|nr:chemotaxis protein CheX [Oscillospiraceae bacterium]